MLAGKPRPLSGRSGARAPLVARGPLQPLAGATSKPNDSGDEAQRSAEALATLETAQRPCVQGPGLAWGTLAPPPRLHLPHLGAPCGSAGGRGPALDAASHRHTWLRVPGRTESYYAVRRPGSSAPGGPWGLANSQTGLGRSSGPAYLWEQPHPPDLRARAVFLNSEKEFDWERGLGLQGN